MVDKARRVYRDGVRIRPLVVEDDADIERYHAVAMAAESFERPWATRRTLNETTVEVRDEDPAEARHLFLAEDDGRVVGAGAVWLPTLDNTSYAFLMPWVEPDHRGKGIGSALMEQLLDTARTQGRTELMVETGYPIDRREDHPYRRFAEKHGFHLANTEIRRVLELPVKDALLDEIVAEAEPHHDGYRFETFDGPIPDELLPSLCETKNQLALDAPTGEMEFEPEAITPEVFRHHEATLRKQGRTMVSTLAVSPEAEAVAYSDLVLLADGNPYVAQWGTLVRRDHRGHRLGWAVKARGLRYIQDVAPERRFVQTCNAEQNQHMVAINERLGFVPVEACPAFLRTL